MDEEFIDSLYADLLIDDNPRALMIRVGELISAHAGIMIANSDGDQKGVAGFGIADDSTKYYFSELQADDWVKEFATLQPKSKVFTSASIANLDEKSKTDYQKYVNDPSDITDSLMIRIADPAGWIGLTFYRPKGSDFEKKDILLAERLHPHISRIFRLLRHRELIQNNVPFYSEIYQLTDKEIQIIELIRGGHSYPQVCSTMSISKNTLKWHMKNIFSKVGATNKADLVSKLIR